MSEAPFVPFYTSDFLAGTSGMTAAAKGDKTLDEWRPMQ